MAKSVQTLENSSQVENKRKCNNLFIVTILHAWRKR